MQPSALNPLFLLLFLLLLLHCVSPWCVCVCVLLVFHNSVSHLFFSCSFFPVPFFSEWFSLYTLFFTSFLFLSLASPCLTPSLLGFDDCPTENKNGGPLALVWRNGQGNHRATNCLSHEPARPLQHQHHCQHWHGREGARTWRGPGGLSIVVSVAVSTGVTTRIPHPAQRQA